MRRFSDYMNASLTDHFHQTLLSNKTTWHLLAFVLIWLFVGNILLDALLWFVLRGVPLFNHNPAVFYLLTFTWLEVLPLFIIAGWWGRWRSSSHNVFGRAFSAIGQWFKLIWQDFKHNWKTILLLILGALLLQIITTQFLQAFQSGLSGHPVTEHSANTQNFVSALKQNGLMLFLIVLVAPMFEELMFRVLLPNAVEAFFTKVHMSVTFGRGLGIVFSALLFASVHEHTFTPLILVYFVLALYLQLIREKTNSITAGFFTHAGNNLFAMLVSLL